MPTTASKKTKAKPELSLAVQYAAEGEGIPTRAQVRRWVKAALEQGAEITVRFVDEREGRELNRDYREKDYATNVLSFVYEAEPVQGDLVICAPVVAREAQEQGKTLEAHYAHLVVHGTLHLQGYDHENDADAQVMEARESEIVTKLGYPDPYLPSA
jgi:probable rRNA maturation factor